MASKGGKDGYYRNDLEKSSLKTPQSVDRVKRNSGDPYWSRKESRMWTGALLVGTCLLYCARSTMPICAATMSESFGWSKKQSGIILSSFFWGYCMTQVLGGHLSDKLGGERVILLSAVTWGLITTITPLSVHVTSHPLTLISFLRFLMGLFQGVHFPALASLFSQRVRESERAFTCSVVGCGSQFGTLVMGGAGSLLLEWYGWETVFYFAGFLTVLWGYCVCAYLLKNKEKGLTFEELEKSFSPSSVTHVNWKQFFKKAPVWAVIIAQVSVASTAFTLFSWMPTFFKERFPDAKGWVFNVVPWVVAIPAAVFSGFLSDYLISKGYKTVWVRKVMQVFGMGVSSLFVLGLGQTDTYWQAILFASLAVGLQTFNHSGVTVNVQDLAPSCAGLLFGVANTGGALLGVIWVYLSGYFIETTGSWDPMFLLVVVVNIIGLLIFTEFAKSERMDTEVVQV
ncbi:solute carrier family 17 member 9 [Pelobates cultripes]|uniref:Voltage-gated purine nucleotide uniporter SLC17A9 n=2 Tax=Pelobates cultripes TaxID=61616 RepID=A0AAD1SMJ4_PELCU|nr:solute carrier family 17 member 9 [Pelobates cultripes]